MLDRTTEHDRLRLEAEIGALNSADGVELSFYDEWNGWAWVIESKPLPDLLEEAREAAPDRLDDQAEFIASWIVRRFESVLALVTSE